MEEPISLFDLFCYSQTVAFCLRRLGVFAYPATDAYALDGHL
jgi:hypothetical protein